MNDGKPHGRKKMCGAKTRAGTPCKRAPNFTGRCNLHGGKSRVWFAHPNYKHGLYSKYSPNRLLYKAMLAREKRREQAAKRLQSMKAAKSRPKGGKRGGK
jgi:hypothetical protein